MLVTSTGPIIKEAQNVQNYKNPIHKKKTHIVFTMGSEVWTV
jgi:hypothetical protein